VSHCIIIKSTVSTGLVRTPVTPRGICGRQSGTGTGFSPVNFIPPVLHYKEKRKKLISFITGLHNKPQGCGASVASAAGPLTTKKITGLERANVMHINVISHLECRIQFVVRVSITFGFSYLRLYHMFKCFHL
jgi:hypothetical protein